MVEGVILKLSAAEAIKSQDALKQATKDTFATIEEQGKKVVELEKQLVDVASAADRATKSQEALSKVQPPRAIPFYSNPGVTPQDLSKAFPNSKPFGQRSAQQGASVFSDDAAAAFRKETEAMLAAVAASTKLDTQSKAAASSVSSVGASAASSASLVGRLAGAAGAGGAAKSVGLLATGTRLLLSSINPVGIATGLAAGAILTFATNALGAETATEKLARAAAEAQKQFSLVNEAVDRTKSNLSSLASVTRDARPFGDTEGAFASLQAEREKLIRVRQDLQRDINRSDNFALDIDGVKKLGEALGETDQFFRDLQKTAENASKGITNFEVGGPSDAALKRLQQVIPLKIQDNTITADAETAMKLLNQQLEKNAAAITYVRKEAGQEIRQFAELTGQIEHQTELEKLGNKERETTIRLQEIRKRLLGPLTAEQQKEIDNALAAAKAYDARVKAEKDLAEQSTKQARVQAQKAQDAEREAASRATLLQSYKDSKDAIEKEAALLTLEGDEREKLRLKIDLTTKAKAAKVPLDEKEVGIIDRLIERLVGATSADKARAKAQKDSKEAGDRLRQSEKERSDILRQVNEDTAILLATTDKEKNAKITLAKLNDALTRTETERGSAAAKQLEDAFKRLEDATDISARREELQRLGEDTFGSIGQNIAGAIQNGANFRQFLQGVYRDLLALATQKAIVEQLAKLGGIAVNSLFNTGPTIDQNTGGVAGSGPYGPGYALGGVLPRHAGASMAANGLILDRYQTFVRGGQRVTTNEGGASTPEAIVPLQRDQYGRLGVSAAGASPSFVINMPNVTNGDEARRIRPTLRQALGAFSREQSRGIRGGR
jgi:hypothetical protein